MQTQQEQAYEQDENSQIVALVTSAGDLIENKGELVFREFATASSHWRQRETYIFVLDPQGNMLIHPDPVLEGKNVIDLEDVNGKPIIKGLINAATSVSEKPQGWYHYQWPVPGGILPRWKSSYVRLVKAPSGNSYIVGCGVYNDKMERRFAVDAVREAVNVIEKMGKAAFPLFHDPKGPFLAKDEYIFVYDMNGVNLVLPPFPNLEGRNLMSFKDKQGKYVIREMLELVKTKGSGWVDYMWPKPGESVSTQKTAYVTKVRIGEQWGLVGAGVYLAEAPQAVSIKRTMTAPDLMALVRSAAATFESMGEKAYPEFRKSGSKWFHDDTYFFVWNMEGVRVFHAAEPAGEGLNMRGMKDILGKPVGQMILDTVASPNGEEWIHYMYPEPGNIFPAWKSTFLKLVKFPDGEPHIIGCGVYNMQMDKAFIEDLVNRAATVVANQGKNAFPLLRDKKGPFYFMDVYVFVNTPMGVEVVNPVFPSLEGRNLLGLKDLKGNSVIQDEINAAMNQGSAWLDFYWFKPGQNTLARKQTYVRKVQSGNEVFFIGSGFYPEEEKNES